MGKKNAELLPLGFLSVLGGAASLFGLQYRMQ